MVSGCFLIFFMVIFLQSVFWFLNREALCAPRESEDVCAKSKRVSLHIIWTRSKRSVDKLRRKEREITLQQEKIQVIKACQVCRIALAGEFPYIVPVNFGAEESENGLALYFHGAMSGRKYELVKKAQEQGKTLGCGFEMDRKHDMVEGSTACDYSYHYESIIGTGEVELLEDVEEKKQGLRCIMKHMTGKDFSFEDKMVEHVAVFCIRVKEYTGKRNQ